MGSPPSVFVAEAGAALSPWLIHTGTFSVLMPCSGRYLLVLFFGVGFEFFFLPGREVAVVSGGVFSGLCCFGGCAGV